MSRRFPMMTSHRRSTHSVGLTLIEVLVAIAIFGMISLVITEIFNTSCTVLDHGTASVDMSNQERETMGRLTALLKAAVPNPNIDATEAIVYPDGKKNGHRTKDNFICFSTSENMLQSTPYSPDLWPANADNWVVDTSTSRYHYYRIRYDSSTHQVLLEELQWPADSTVVPSVVQSPPESRVLAYGTADSRITSLEFTHPVTPSEQGSVQIDLAVQTQTRTATREEQTVTERLRTVLELPYYSTQ